MCRSMRWTALVAVVVIAAGCADSPFTGTSKDTDQVPTIVGCDPLGPDTQPCNRRERDER